MCTQWPTPRLTWHTDYNSRWLLPANCCYLEWRAEVDLHFADMCMQWHRNNRMRCPKGRALTNPRRTIECKILARERALWAMIYVSSMPFWGVRCNLFRGRPLQRTRRRLLPILNNWAAPRYVCPIYTCKKPDYLFNVNYYCELSSRYEKQLGN